MYICAWQAPELPPWDESRVTDADEEIVISHNWHELRRFMWDYVGIVRTNKRLERARHRISLLSEEILEYYSNFRVSADLLTSGTHAIIVRPDGTLQGGADPRREGVAQGE